jgi:hypothetical protein
MQISIVSSLTPDDERRCAAAFFRTICSLLDLLPIAYSVRVKTSGKTLNHTHSPTERRAPGFPERAASFPDEPPFHIGTGPDSR